MGWRRKPDGTWEAVTDSGQVIATSQNNPFGGNSNADDVGLDTVSLPGGATALGYLQEPPFVSEQSEFGRDWLVNYLKQKGNQFPTRSIADMTDRERGVLDSFDKLMRGELTSDPASSPAWKAVKEEHALETEKGMGRIQRQNQISGMGYSGPGYRGESEYSRGRSRDLTTGLADLYSKTRMEDLTATQAAAGSMGYERSIDQAKRDATYDAIRQNILSKISVAGGLSGLPFTPVPQQNWIISQPYPEQDDSYGGMEAAIDIAGLFF